MDFSPLGTSVQTALGWMAIVWNETKLLRLSFGHLTAAAARRRVNSNVQWCDSRLSARQHQLVRRLKSYAEGTPESFRDIPVDVVGMTRFHRDVIAACRNIPLGSTCNYGELAELAGYPRAARAVGNVMAHNRTPLVVPCHRVVAKGAGQWGGFGAIGGVRTKIHLLNMERQAALSVN